jgi:hypothetical protein
VTNNPAASQRSGAGSPPRGLAALDQFEVPIIGLSATPWTKGLGAYFKKLVVANTIKDMISQKTLAPFRVFAPAHPDLKGVRTVAGDYHEGDLGKAMNKPKLVADVVESWKTFGDNRPTIVFAVNRAHADQLRNEFEAGGVRAGYMDCESPISERMIVRSQLQGGQIKVVCNVDVIGLGVDWPEISCIVLARPTKSFMRYVQNVGRGLRIAPDKTDLIVIDHSDTTLTMGYVSDIHFDELDDGKKSLTAAKVIALPKECPKCHFAKPPKMAKRPNCGFIAQHHAEPIKPAAGMLLELNGDVFKVAPVAKKLGSKSETYGQLVWLATSKHYNNGWAARKHREIYGTWPRGLDYEPHVRPPDMVLASWIIPVECSDGRVFESMAEAARAFGVRTPMIKYLVETHHLGKLGVRFKRALDEWLPLKTLSEKIIAARTRNGTRHHTSEAKHKMHLARQGTKPSELAIRRASEVNCRAVIAISGSGEQFRFESIISAAVSVHGKRKAAAQIVRALKGGRPTAYGFKWEYVCNVDSFATHGTMRGTCTHQTWRLRRGSRLRIYDGQKGNVVLTMRW